MRARDKSNIIAVCGARYKTRPGLSYHYNHTHKEPGSSSNSSTIPPLEEQEHEGQQTSSSLGGGSLTPPSTPGGILQELTPEMIPGASSGAIRLIAIHLKIRFLIIILLINQLLGITLSYCTISQLGDTRCTLGHNFNFLSKHSILSTTR